MTDFSKLFEESKGSPIKYRDLLIFRIDRYQIKNNDKYLITFEETNSEWRQGIKLKVNGFIHINEQRIKNDVFVWQDTASKSFEILLETKNNSELIIKNIWDTGNGVAMSLYWGSAMYKEIIDNGFRYFCNDGHPDENFDDVVFTIEKL